jgi:hypothetical protein
MDNLASNASKFQYVVYIVTIGNKNYIGKTSGLTSETPEKILFRRMGWHFGRASRHQATGLLHKEIWQNGLKRGDVSSRVLGVFENQEDASEFEVLAIRTHKTHHKTNENGLNKIASSTGGHTHSDEVRAKIGATKSSSYWRNKNGSGNCF